MEGTDKLFTLLGDRPILAHAVQPFEDSDLVHKIVLVVQKGRLAEARRLARAHNWSKVVGVCIGGARRQDSVRRGLERINGCQWVLVHDGARPFVDGEMISRGLETARDTGAATAAVPVKDTVKLVSGGVVKATPRRADLWAVQTPQVFRADIILDAHSDTTEDVTDDAMLVERRGNAVRIFRGSYDNIKITTPEDVAVAERIFERRAGVRAVQEEGLRVGIGYDVHRLVAGRRLVLGGIAIPFPRGLEGHSDADVLVHSVMDALLGAAGQRDIGTHFPSDDERYRDVSSIRLLLKVRALLEGAGWKVANVDVTVVAQEPYLSDYIGKMRIRISRTLRLKVNQVGIKATTAEGLGFAGRGEGIASLAVVALKESQR